MKINKQNTVIIILGILLVFALLYIAVNQIQKRDVRIANEGAQYGYEQAIVQIAQQAATCNPVPLNVGNQTVEIVAVECLKTQGS